MCFVGDGINDIIALKAAQVSISLKGATRVATDTAQVVLLDGTLNHIPALFRLSDEFERTMRNNLRSSLIPGTFCIAGVYLLHFGIPAAIIIGNIGNVVGLSNTLLPLLKHRARLAIETSEKK
uniref:ATPase, P-type (Transporting), HAD superfamily, subfamily IC n=1 Tax=Candidatus Kentrum sp. LPFa TaxID=2126335 RepID=A0A450WSA6_9GAMM|nr:MAG: ATPase, P-type (transporting), HAD superfamily, subfamily IC [Candidatus Kentron sp. LPFa]